MKNTTDEEWKKKLTPKQYHVMREKGTEAPFTGKYVHHNEKGLYTCAACGHELFSSEAKFELSYFNPNTGWPSFDSPTNPENVELKPDDSYGMHRIEVICKNCGSHLGHLFDDGPKETTGQHYCVNSCALEFKKEK